MAQWVDPDAGYETAFSDGFPFLLTSYESLKALNSALPQPVPMNRFRPNIVVAGLEEAFEEDRWAEMDVTGGPRRAAFQAPKPCARCKVEPPPRMAWTPSAASSGWRWLSLPGSTASLLRILHPVASVAVRAFVFANWSGTHPSCTARPLARLRAGRQLQLLAYCFIGLAVPAF